MSARRLLCAVKEGKEGVAGEHFINLSRTSAVIKRHLDGSHGTWRE